LYLKDLASLQSGLFITSQINARRLLTDGGGAAGQKGKKNLQVN
jgi:hypothetical protein